jgi:hypothetical protein
MNPPSLSIPSSIIDNSFALESSKKAKKTHQNRKIELMSRKSKRKVDSVLTPPTQEEHEHEQEQKEEIFVKKLHLQKQKQKPQSSIPVDVLENKASEVDRFWAYNQPLPARTKNLLFDLVGYYDDDTMERLIVPRSIKSLAICKDYELNDEIQKEISGISLRAIEWLVTNYSKGTKIVLFNKASQTHVDIHGNYEIQSNYFKRNLFDPFCRHGRVYFQWRLKSKITGQYELITMETTVGQLNFMKWADEQGVLEYARQNQHHIQETMENTLSEVNREKKLFKKMGKTRKRKELTKDPDIACVVYKIDTKLMFNQMDWDA